MRTLAAISSLAAVVLIGQALPASAAVLSAAPAGGRAAPCAGNAVRIFLGTPQAGAGHGGIPVLFKNTSRAACTLHGYPRITVSTSSSKTRVPAVPTASGYLGGLQTLTSPVPLVLLKPGQVASAEVEGIDTPADPGSACPLFHTVTVSLPKRDTMVTLTDASPIPGCSSVSVHPFVAGALGSNMSPPSTGTSRPVRGHSTRPANLSPGTAWGIDTASTTSPAYLTELDQKLGTPQFVGRYLVYGGGMPLQASEASFLHNSNVSILLVVSPANRNLTSASTAVSEANTAISAAEALGVPQGVALFRDVENYYTISSAYIQSWWKTISNAGYIPGFYENPLSGSSDFDSAYCAAVASNGSIGSGVALYSDEPELNSYSYPESAAPAWAADVPSCSNKTTAWQYKINYKTPNADVDEYQTDSSYLWGPDQVSLGTLCHHKSVQINAQNGCPYKGQTKIGTATFRYLVLIEDNDQSVHPAFWDLINFPRNTCQSVKLSFGMPASGSKPKDTAWIKVKTKAGVQSLSVKYGQVATLTATLDGDAWSLENSATNPNDQIAINGTASCSTGTGY